MATKDYAKIAAARITKPSESKRYPRFLIYSRNKKGKTTFGISAGVDRTLVLDPEHGTDEMKSKDPNVWHIEKWEDYDDIINYLRFTPHPYQWVVVDGLTKVSNISLKYVMRLHEEKSLDRIPGMVQLKDYGKSGELMKEMLNKFHALPMGVIFIANERMDTASNSEEDDDVSFEEGSAMFVADLPKGVRGAVNSIVDIIGRLYIVRVDDGSDGKTKPERRLWIGESLKYDTGYRSDFVLPDFIRVPTIPKLVRLMRTGSAVPAKK